MRRIIELTGDLFIIATGLIFLMVGVLFYILYPVGYTAQEPNPFIFWMECILYLVMILVGVSSLINDRQSGFREIMGDIIIFSGGIILLSIFAVIYSNDRFIFYQSETLFIYIRAIIGALIITLGIDRFIDDA